MKKLLIGVLAFSSLVSYAKITQIHHDTCKVATLSFTGPEEMKSYIEEELTAKGYDLSNQDHKDGLRITMGRQLQACQQYQQREAGSEFGIKMRNLGASISDTFSCAIRTSYKHISINDIVKREGNSIEVSSVYAKGVQTPHIFTSKTDRGFKRAIKWALKNTPDCN